MQKGQTQVLILAGIVLFLTAAGGIFFLGRITGSKPQTQTPVATYSPQPTPTPDETANWKTYTNEQFGYSFKYPSHFTLTDESDKEYFKAYQSVQTFYSSFEDIDRRFQVFIKDNPKNVSASDVMNEKISELKNGDSAGKTTAAKIANTLKPYVNGEINGVYALSGWDYDIDTIFFTTKNNVFEFTYIGSDGELNQILSTFRFTN